MQDPRSLFRGLLAGSAVLMLTVAVLVAGAWSTKAGWTLAMVGWMASVGFGALAYRGRPPMVRTLTRVALVTGVASLVLALVLLFIGVQVRGLLAGNVIFGSAGDGCALEGSTETFTLGEPIYQVAYLTRRVEPGEFVTLALALDGSVVAEGSSTVAVAFDCVGAPVDPPGPGTYAVSVSAADEILATGSFEVRLAPA